MYLKLRDSAEKGFSLIEIMMSIGFATAGAMFLASMNSQMNKEVKKANQVIDMLQLQELFNKKLRDVDYCSCLLRGKVIDQKTFSIGKTTLIEGLPRKFSPAPPFPQKCLPSDTMMIPGMDKKIDGSQVEVDSFEVTQLLNIAAGYFIGDFKVKFKSKVKKLKTDNFSFTSAFYGPPPLNGNLPVTIDRCLASQDTNKTYVATAPIYSKRGELSLCRKGDRMMMRRWIAQNVLHEGRFICQTTLQWSELPPTCPTTETNSKEVKANVWDGVLCHAI